MAAVAARTALQAAGLPTNAIGPGGTIDPEGLLAIAFDKMEIRTALTKPVVIDLMAPSTGAGSQLIQDVQPAVILTGRAGTVTIAPAGVPDGTNVRAAQAVASTGLGLAAAIGGLVLLGAALL